MIAKSHDTTLTIVSRSEIEITRTFNARATSSLRC